ncbi:uncharacterized protein PHACADRAFT_249898 [Phanerochaete carnosa HHB-10118-sp]|uniref:JmjC domain-containing protein n=1 Tax=Phanerochaete carnosa (strain HHB-10118-sp) TaxID=650164 RepID=K5W681_PHACS|nr:uncharacterized protein PHACADRAFT_249898 [Phanerochaete carnosa HHB-10118-sp]EKM59423.1 hypothetical protein PHACADRAFT_249898 [Phanerochaete carnosa HHB-10118-sp]
MNGLHEQNHKRTSINELLNPVANVPASGSLDSSYSPPQLGVMPNPSYVHAPRAPTASSYHSGMSSAPGSSFSLRAASWDHASTNEGEVGRGQAAESPSDCRYAAGNSHPQSHQAHPHQSQSQPHAPYPEQYQRSRPVGEPANYGIDVAHWAPSHLHYGAQMLTPLYQDDRAGYPHPQGFDQQEMHQQVYNGYLPILFGQPTTRSMQPPQLAQQHTANSRMPPVYIPQHMNSHAVAFAAFPIMMPAHPPPAKRSLEPEDAEAPAKAKKSRGKGKAPESNGNGIARRNYPKKRSESTPQMDLKEKEANANSAIQASNLVDENGNPVDPGHSLHPELQFARCMSNRYRSEEFPRCVSCTRRWAGDTCRFQGIRFFLKDENRNIIGISFIENQKADGPSMNFPVKWNAKLDMSHITRIKRTVARALLPVLKQEQEHIQRRDVIRRNRESEVRATCDTCMTSIFSTSWMCRLCGREACAECFQQVSELTTEPPGAAEAEIVALQAKREKHAHVNPFFLSCTRRNEHRASDFSPMSRFSKEELTEAIAEMEALLGQAPDGEIVAKSSPEASNGSAGSTEQTGESSASGQISNSTLSSLNTPSLSPDADTDKKPIAELASDSAKPAEPSSSTSAPPPPEEAVSPPSIPFYEPRVFSDAELTDEVFSEMWAKGEPLVVTGLLPKFRISWTPEYFTQKYGTQTCLILECQTDLNKRVSVGEFFSWFGKYEGRRDCWKLKDWPPSTDFKTAFPELYEDFANGTPAPNYVRRDGVLNVAAHFPNNTVAPDLGPKMYNAMASYESEGSKGSTRLHLDMADAVNVMLYASSTPGGEPGSAAWDLFRAEDSSKIRKFLKRKFKGQFQHDPIHSQQFYLDAPLRKELYEEFSVKSYRIYQKPGEAVFIPAGCAHQVCNLADCIKVACDFISPDNIDRCENLTKEFREQNQSMAWKEDVLQLRTAMWFAWLSCSRQEKEMRGESSPQP